MRKNVRTAIFAAVAFTTAGVWAVANVRTNGAPSSQALESAATIDPLALTLATKNLPSLPYEPI